MEQANNARILVKTKKTNLYDLPKDMLVKLVSTVQQDKDIQYVKREAGKFYDDTIKSLFEDIYPQYKHRTPQEKEHFVNVYTQTVMNINPKMIDDDEEYPDYQNEITDTVYKAFEMEDYPLKENGEADIYMELMDSIVITYHDLTK